MSRRPSRHGAIDGPIVAENACQPGIGPLVWASVLTPEALGSPASLVRLPAAWSTRSPRSRGGSEVADVTRASV